MGKPASILEDLGVPILGPKTVKGNDKVSIEEYSFVFGLKKLNLIGGI
jgi:hypothetical protein